MRMELAMTERRHAGQLSDEEIRLSLEHAKALIALYPSIEIHVTLAIYISELLREIRKRPDLEFPAREISDFGDREESSRALTRRCGSRGNVNHICPRRSAVRPVPQPPRPDRV
jgi:hypothetical protein